jgi:hypothetical protein
VSALDVLELELRQLHGVVGVGLEEEGDGLLVRIALAPGVDAADVERRATMLARAHAEHVTVATVGADATDDISGRTRHSRVRLLAVVRVPTTDELEVHLAFGGRRTIGRRRGSGAVTGAVEATLEALEALGAELPFRPLWAEPVHPEGDRSHTIAVGLTGSPATDATTGRYGIAAGMSAEEAAVRATLHALNRHLGVTLHAA